MRVLALLLLIALLSLTPMAAEAQSPSGPSRIPPDAKPPGERNPLLGAIAIAAMVLAGAGGIYIYILIRKGI